MDSFVNGSLGTIIDIVADPYGYLKYLIIKFDMKKAGVEHKESNAQIANKYAEDTATPTFRQKIKYHLSGSGNKTHAAKATLCQFSIKLAFALLNIRRRDKL